MCYREAERDKETPCSVDWSAIWECQEEGEEGMMATCVGAKASAGSSRFFVREFEVSCGRL